MKNLNLKKIAIVAIVFALISIGIVFAQNHRYSVLVDTLDRKCVEHISEAKDNFSSFIQYGSLEHYISGTDNLHAFLSLYEISSYYQVDNFSAIKAAHLRLITSQGNMATNRVKRLVDALEILESDIHAAPGYSELDIFNNYDSYNEGE